MDHLVLDSSQKKVIQDAGIKKLYVKFFDVWWNPVAKAPNATAKLVMDKKTKVWLETNKVEVVPVVFITNECLERIYAGKYNALAERIYGLLNGQLNTYEMLQDVHEIQFNCDWSDSSKETYFNLINYLKMLPLILDRKMSVSAAIYFDQYQNTKSLGIPPVNRVMLMCFSSLKQDATRNTIRTFKDDVASLGKYPLPLDIAFALPPDKFLYRKDRLTGIMQNMYDTNRQDSIISKLMPNAYKVNIDTSLNRIQVLKGDDIYEPPGDIEKTLNYEMVMKPKLSSNTAAIGIFWTDSTSARKYAASYLTQLYTGMQ